MLVVLGVIVIIGACALLVYYTSQMRQQNLSEYNTVEDLKRRIDELDDDNVEINTNQGSAKIIVPDIVDPDESTRTSTQKEECKEYTVGPKQKIEKTVIGTDKKDEIFVNSEIERVEDEENNPIKEEEGIISKILKNKDEQ